MSGAQVFQLPDSMQRQWRAVEVDLRRALAAVRCTEAEAEHIVCTMRPMYLELATAKSEDISTMTGDDAVASVEAWVKGLLYGLLVQIAARELTLLRAGLV